MAEGPRFDKKLEFLLQWCSHNGFDPYISSGLRPAYFEYGVRGVQCLPAYPGPQSSDSDSQPHALTYVTPPISDPNPSIHQIRSLVQFIDATDNHKIVQTTDILTDHTVAEYPPDNIITSGAPINACFSNQQGNGDGQIAFPTQKVPILNTPYHMMLSPQRLLMAHPLLLLFTALSAFLNSSSLSLFSRYLHLPVTPTETNNDTTNHYCLLDLIILHCAKHAATQNSNIALLFSLLSRSVTHLSELRTVILQSFGASDLTNQPNTHITKTTTPTSPLFSDVDVMILAQIEYRKIMDQLAHLDSPSASESVHCPSTQKPCSPLLVPFVTHPSKANLLPYMMALPSSYDTPLHWSWDDLDSFIFLRSTLHNSAAHSPSTGASNAHPIDSTTDPTTPSPSINTFRIDICSEINLRFCEWVRLTCIIVVVNIALRSSSLGNEFSSLKPLLILQPNELLACIIEGSDRIHSDGTLPPCPILFDDFLHAFSTIATRAVHTPPLPEQLINIPPPKQNHHSKSRQSVVQPPGMFSSALWGQGTAASIQTCLGELPDCKSTKSLRKLTLGDSWQHFCRQLGSQSRVASVTQTSSNGDHIECLNLFGHLFNKSSTETQDIIASSLAFAIDGVTADQLAFLPSIYAALGSSAENDPLFAFHAMIDVMRILPYLDTTCYSNHVYNRFESIGHSFFADIDTHRHAESLQQEQTQQSCNHAIALSAIRSLIPLPTSSTTFESWVTATCQLSSSSTTTGSWLPQTNQALVPFFDLFNHSDKVDVAISWINQRRTDHLRSSTHHQQLQSSSSSSSSSSETFYSLEYEPSSQLIAHYPLSTITSTQNNSIEASSHSPGCSEVFISYGALGNLMLFARYGFVLPNNIQDTFPISIQVIDGLIQDASLLYNESTSPVLSNNMRNVKQPLPRHPVQQRPICVPSKTIGGQSRLPTTRPVVQKPSTKPTQSQPQSILTNQTITITRFSSLQTQLLNRLQLTKLLDLPASISFYKTGRQAMNLQPLTRALEQFPHEQQIITRLAASSLCAQTQRRPLMFNLHQQGLPFDLMVYILLRTLPPTILGQGHHATSEPSIVQLTTTLSEEMAFSHQHATIAKCVMHRLALVLFFSSFDSYITDIDPQLAQRFVSLIDSTQNAVIQRQADQTDVSHEAISQHISESEYLQTALYNTIWTRLLTISNTSHLPDYWIIIVQTLIRSHLQIIFGLLLQPVFYQ